ncbi:hypothetical protein SAMN06264364_12383 [Quadrisphaera granulorum]|uniref:Uncharacterized protein n=1 Tax=Quadrisphaera granulorum TaxID=317664 RepID=A0A315ZY95_9ACTN|nr:hypothetical protein [Quadrisphaera granulorum]PWJ50273.1 hypothetical protein BXY45_12383 [Quadrisphaera granulorum]SZE98039.1 hypothetical protein SAMN06264364_12383 [Quadrisphaera granulorum]
MTTTTAPAFAPEASTAPAAVRAPSPLDVVALQTTKRFMTFAVPLVTLGLVLLVSGVIAAFFYQMGSRPGTDEWISNSRNNPGVLWALPGFLGYYGVQSVATTFPFALALGTSRRAFTTGTLAFHGLLSAYIAVVGLVLLGVERLTGQWFVGLYLMDVVVLGGGDPLRLVGILFFGSLTMLSLGALFAAAWVRFGPRGPVVLGITSAALLAAVALLLAPHLGAVADAFQLWWLAATAAGIIAVACVGELALLRRASVR